MSTDAPNAAAAADWPLPFWIAHRGAGKLAPENTLAAFRLGASLGYRAFECDVKLSADGQPFLLHDTTLDRTSNHRGMAAARSWSELARVDAGAWHSRIYAGEPPPSLEAIAAYVLANGFALNIEIKPTPGDEERTGRVVAEHVLRLWAGRSAWPLFSSFRPEALFGAKETAPAVPRGLLLDSLWNGWQGLARDLDCRAIICNYNLMSSALLAEIHGAGMRAMVYTVNDPAPAAWLQDLGIDGIITDAVDRFSPTA